MKIDLWHGDCLDLMKNISDESVHAIITDIPYGISFSEWDVLHTNTNHALLGQSPAQKNKDIFKTRGKPKNGWSQEDKKISEQFQSFCFKYLQESFRVLKPAGVIVAFTGRQYQHRYTIAGEDAGLIHRDTLAWDKGQAPFRAQAIGKVIGKRTGDYSNMRRLGNLAPVFEPIVIMFKPYPIGGTITDCYLQYGTGTFDSSISTSNIISISSRIENRLHETEKPEELMEKLCLLFTEENQTVLDMFMGSGTTGKVCKKLNRNFIGIEKEKKYFDIATERLK